MGGDFAESEDSGNVVRRPIDIVDSTGALLENISFRPAQTFDVSDQEQSYFVQDHWIVTPSLALDAGVRTASQQISGTLRVAPRFGFVWRIPGPTQTILRGGYGYFYDRVPLNVYAFNRYPDRVITDYAPDGSILSGPILYLNTLGQNRVRRPFVSQAPIDGNFSPRSTIWNLQIEQSITKKLKLRATYLHNNSDGLVVMDVVPPDATTATGSYLLEGSGRIALSPVRRYGAGQSAGGPAIIFLLHPQLRARRPQRFRKVFGNADRSRDPPGCVWNAGDGCS